MDKKSTDDTIDILYSLNSSKIRVISEQDNGIYDAMNKGISKSLGEWLYFLGSDDYLWNDEVLLSVSKEITSGRDVIYGNVISNGLMQNHIGEWSLDNLKNNRCHQAIFYKRSIFATFGNYNCNYKSCADFDLNLKCFLKNPEKVKYVNMTIAFFCAGGYSSYISR